MITFGNCLLTASTELSTTHVVSQLIVYFSPCDAVLQHVTGTQDIVMWGTVCHFGMHQRYIICKPLGLPLDRPYFYYPSCLNP